MIRTKTMWAGKSFREYAKVGYLFNKPRFRYKNKKWCSDCVIYKLLPRQRRPNRPEA